MRKNKWAEFVEYYSIVDEVMKIHKSRYADLCIVRFNNSAKQQIFWTSQQNGAFLLLSPFLLVASYFHSACQSPAK